MRVARAASPPTGGVPPGRARTGIPRRDPAGPVCALTVHETDGSTPWYAVQRAPDVLSEHARLARAHVRLQSRRIAEHEHRDAVRVDPGVIADGFYVIQDDARIAAVQAKAP